MPDLKLNLVTGDVDVTNGRASLTDDTTGETTAQYVRTRLRLFKGEWFLNNQDGLDYAGLIFVKSPNMSIVQGLLKARILETPGVLSMLSYSQVLDKSARTLRVVVSIKNDTGKVLNINGVLGQ